MILPIFLVDFCRFQAYQTNNTQYYQVAINPDIVENKTPVLSSGEHKSLSDFALIFKECKW
jgi:uncharacterized protein YifN (PemK superfamily)